MVCSDRRVGVVDMCQVYRSNRARCRWSRTGREGEDQLCERVDDERGNGQERRRRCQERSGPHPEHQLQRAPRAPGTGIKQLRARLVLLLTCASSGRCAPLWGIRVLTCISLSVRGAVAKCTHRSCPITSASTRRHDDFASVVIKEMTALGEIMRAHPSRRLPSSLSRTTTTTAMHTRLKAEANSSHIHRLGILLPLGARGCLPSPGFASSGTGLDLVSPNWP